MYYTTLEIYRAFRSASGKPYRLPKDWEKHLETKMTKPNREAIKLLTDYFNTKWKNISLDRYMACGFEVHKGTFTYVKFFDKRIMALYITKDKTQKYALDMSKKKMVNTAKFILDKCRALGYTSLVEYARVRDGYESLCITDYLKGDIDVVFLDYLVYKRYLILESYDEERLVWYMENIREVRSQTRAILQFLENLEVKLNEHYSKT